MLQSIYTKNSVEIWVRPDYELFAYSDGDEVEERLLDQLHKATDLSVASNELQRLIIDWPSEYHFSPLRSNLLSPFGLERFENILEIGSGCGALTRFLGEQCSDSSVLALEGSGRRAEITKTRCRDLSNVEVCHDSFADFEADGKFDCITLIGVLEYSPAFYDDVDPVLATLKKAQTLLTTDGVLIVAIENQFGLKYFNGCAEDHSGRLFTGINNDYKSDGYVTFGRKGLSRKISRAGFESIDFVYPFPDYKLPRLLLKECSLIHPGFDVSCLPGQYPSRDYTGNDERFFHESETWPLLVKNDMLRDMSNSFLIFASKEKTWKRDIASSWLAQVFSCPRKKQFLSYSIFRDNGKGVSVDKWQTFIPEKKLTGDSQCISHHLRREQYIAGTPYSQRFLKQIEEVDSFSSFVEYLRPWVAILASHQLPKAEVGDVDVKMIPGTLLDCLPSNLIVDKDNKIHVFDQEWEWCTPLEMGFVLFRGIYRELSVHIQVLERTNLFTNTFGTVFQVICALFLEFGYQMDEDVLDHYIAREVEIQKELIVYQASTEELQNYFKVFFNQTRPLRVDINNLVLTTGINRCGTLQTERDAAYTDREAVLEELSAIKKGWSWRIGRFVTYLPRLLKKSGSL